MIKVIAYLPGSYSRVIRAEQIFKYLNRTGEFECLISPEGVTDQALMWADIIFAKETVDPKALSMYWAYKMERNKILIVDRDDALKVDDDHPLAGQHKQLSANAWQRELVKIANHVTCTTQEIKDEILPLNEKVSIIPNYLDMEMWNITPPFNVTDTLRIGWSGSVTHRADLDLALPSIRRILQEYPTTRFYTCGDPYAMEQLKDLEGRVEFIPGTVEMHWWPRLAQTLMYDIAIAPLADTHFNRCRSNLKYLEYSMTGAATVCSPTAYSGIVKDGVNGLIAKDGDFYTPIKKLIEDRKLRLSIRNEAHKLVKREYDLSRHIGKYSKLFKDLYGKHI